MSKKFSFLDLTRNKLHTVDSEFLLQWYAEDTHKDIIDGRCMEDFVKLCEKGEYFNSYNHNYLVTCIEVQTENPLKTYSIPFTFESFMRIEVQATNIKEACVLALKKFLTIPDENYLEDSFRFDWEGIDTTEDLPNEEEVIEEVFK